MSTASVSFVFLTGLFLRLLTILVCTQYMASAVAWDHPRGGEESPSELNKLSAGHAAAEVWYLSSDALVHEVCLGTSTHESADLEAEAMKGVLHFRHQADQSRGCC